MSASTSARDRDSGIRTTLTATILAPRGRRPRGNLCVASGRGWSGELSIWRKWNLSGRPDRRGRRTKRRRDVGRPGQNTGSAQRQRSKASQGQGHRRSPRGSTHYPQSSHAGCRVASPVHRAVSRHVARLRKR